MKTSGGTRREIAKVCLMNNDRATHSVVVTREGG
jgi:hypothetical protein